VIAQGSTVRYVGAVIASVLAGVLVAVQTRVNGELGAELEQGTLAALISFASGLIFVAAFTLTTAKGRRGVRTVATALRNQTLPWWAVIGGLFGALLVLTQGLSAGVLGVALFSVAVVTGQAMGAVAIDSRGWLGAPKIRLGAWRIVGALAVLVGVVIAVDLPSGELSKDSALFLLPLVAGLGVGYQQAVNGWVRSVAGSPASATLINFMVGTAALLLATMVSLPFVGLPDSYPGTWWLWTGGAVGAVFIAIQITTVSIVGVLGLGVSLVTGQLLGSILLDVFVPVGNSSVTPETILGAVITLVGALVVTLSRRKA
jgi:bacterial/archaeal transporter family-2 protein